MVVMTMTAVDYDDPNEGTNAKLVYSIEKNVIEEETGQPIFEIEPETGVIKTAVCCLDRERTPDYSIQVVAMDGGGLKGNVSFVLLKNPLIYQLYKSIKNQIKCFFTNCENAKSNFRYGDSINQSKRYK